MPAFGKFCVFAGVAGKPGAGDVRPVLTGIDTAGEAVNFVDVTPEGFSVVSYRGMPGTSAEKRKEASAVVGLASEEFRFLESGLDFFLRGNTCRCNYESKTCILLVNEVPGLTSKVDCFLCMGFRRFGFCPAFDACKVSEGFSYAYL